VRLTGGTLLNWGLTDGFSVGLGWATRGFGAVVAGCWAFWGKGCGARLKGDEKEKISSAVSRGFFGTLIDWNSLIFSFCFLRLASSVKSTESRCWGTGVFDSFKLEADLGVDGVVKGLVTADLDIPVCLIVKVGVLSDFGVSILLFCVVGVKAGDTIALVIVLVFGDNTFSAFGEVIGKFGGGWGGKGSEFVAEFAKL
jgi:hypothetical protein